MREPPRVLTVDPGQNRSPMQKLAGLDPAIALFGHGPPLRDARNEIRAFLDALRRRIVRS